MGKFYSYFFFLLLPFFASAQLYIKSSTGGADAYLYNKGEILYVTQDIGMDGNPNQTGGNLYLRNEGQLIQGSDTSENSGTGVVSVFQKNSMNKWDYHFWTSPVGDPDSNEALDYAATNSGNKRFYQGSNNGGGIYQPTTTELLSNPITFTTGYDGVITGSNQLQFSSYWLYKYVAKNGYSGYEKVSAGTDLNPGEGYTMKGIGDNTTPTSETIDFRGIPNNGTISVKVLADNLTMVGNPYSSAMNLSFYLLSNSGASATTLANCFGTSNSTGRSAASNSINGNAYFWESDPTVQSHYLVDYEGGYGTYTPGPCNSVGTYTPAVFVRYDNDGNEIAGSATGDSGQDIKRHFAPIGQGFFVEGTTAGEVVAKNEFRVFVKESPENLSQFKNKTDKFSKSTLTQNSNYEVSTLRAGFQTFDNRGYLILPEFNLQTFINNTYNRLLKGIMYEGATLQADIAMDGYNISELSTDVSFNLSDTDRPIITNYFPYDLEVKLPLTINGAKESNTYRMQISDLNFITDDGIWLHDKVTDEYHDILDNSYEFTLPKGVYPDRYEITFKDFNAATLEVVEEVKKSFAVYQNNSRAELTVLNPLETELKEISVFDITGRLLASKINEGTNNKVVISSSNWSDGIYIVKVITRDNVEFSKKVSVINMK
ncbi:T9SS sorting signal type C domain-containing protein [Leeuwenhoekiella aequorea]|uniref:T9SS sorting signal type C domain-containing protein n=1 Tax=Leeuwenhoekiella aequorea TaxID=283736 RepID=UPI00352DA64C